MDEKIAMEIIIRRGMEIPSHKDAENLPSAHDRDSRPPSQKKPGRQSQHRVLSEEAKRKQWGDLEGAVVEAKTTQRPSPPPNPPAPAPYLLGSAPYFASH